MTKNNDLYNYINYFNKIIKGMTYLLVFYNYKPLFLCFTFLHWNNPQIGPHTIYVPRYNHIYLIFFK